MLKKNQDKNVFYIYWKYYICYYNAISLFCQRFYCLNFCVDLYYNKYSLKGVGFLDISKRLKEIRKAKNISVYKLSQLSGVSETHIRDLERGDRNPSIDTLSRLSVPLGITLPELLNESDNISYLSVKEQELIKCFRNLTDDKADALLAFLKTL